MEREYSQIQRSLVQLVDQITLKKGEIDINDANRRYDALLKELDPIIFTHLQASQSKQDVVELNNFMKQLRNIKNLVYESSLQSLSYLKLVHQPLGTTDYEKSLKTQIQSRDDTNYRLIELKKEYLENSQTIVSLQEKLRVLIRETGGLLNELPSRDEKATYSYAKSYITKNPELLPVLKDIKRSKTRSLILSDFLLALVKSLNVNWSNDEFLTTVVLESGLTDENILLQNLMDQVSDDEEEEED